MSTSVIKQIVSNTDNSQTIKMIVRSNERGPRGPKGDTGLQGPQGIQGPRGFDGAIQYRAGTGIKITDDNTIEATGDATSAWGGIQGDIADQTDLQQEFDEYTKTADLGAAAISNDYDDLNNKPTIGNGTLTIQSDGTTVGTFTANSTSNVTANVIPPVRVGSIVSEPTDIEFVDTANIVDEAVTADKIDWMSVERPYYVAGDTITITTTTLCGSISDDTTKVKWTIPLCKSLAKVSSATVALTALQNNYYFKGIPSGTGRPTVGSYTTSEFNDMGLNFTSGVTDSSSLTQYLPCIGKFNEITITFS